MTFASITPAGLEKLDQATPPTSLGYAPLLDTLSTDEARPLGAATFTRLRSSETSLS